MKRQPSLRGIIEDFYDIQGYRLEVGNQIGAIERGDAEGDVTWMKENIFDGLVQIEDRIEKKVSEWVKQHPLWDYWLSDVKGVGPLIAGGLLGWIEDVEKFATISKLWKYCGLAVDADGKAIRRKKGEKISWNPRMKTLCWKLGESFVKTKGGYRKIYDDFRENYERKYPNETKAHIYLMAKRKTVKVFLAHLHQVWSEMKGNPIQKPFIIGKTVDGVHHEHEIPVVRDGRKTPTRARRRSSVHLPISA